MTTPTKTITPTLRFPEFRNKAGWEVNVLSNYGHFLSPLSGKKKEDFGAGNAKYITYMNIFNNHFIDMNLLGVVNVDSTEKQNLVKKGDVFFTASSETPNDAGMASVLIEDIDNCYANSFCKFFRFNYDNKTDFIFLGYALRQPLVRRYFSQHSQGVTRFNLSKSIFDNSPILLPSLKEQQKIAECLSSVDDLIAAEKQKLEALQEHKKGLMQVLFPAEGKTTPKLRFPEFRNKAGWEVKPLGKITVAESSIRALNKLEFLEEGYPVYGASGLAGLIESCDQHDDYIAIVKDGAGVGRLFFYRGDSSILGTLNYIKPIDNKSISLRWVYYLLQTIDFSKYIKGSGIPHIYYSDYKNEFVFVAPIKEQQKIAECLSSVDYLITAEKQKLEALQEHKKGLMQVLFPNSNEIIKQGGSS